MVIPLFTSPALFNKVKLQVELGEEQHVKATFFTMLLEERSDTLKVRLGVAIGTTGRAIEAVTLPFQVMVPALQRPLSSL
jgi:hypothetical protein